MRRNPDMRETQHTCAHFRRARRARAVKPMSARLFPNDAGDLHFTSAPKYLALFCIAAVSASAQTVIYFDDFSGLNSSDLHGTAPDTRPDNETWIANTGGNGWKADGFISGSGPSNAFLPFSPVAGNRYTLSIDANPVNANSNWFAVGFSQYSAVDEMFVGGDVGSWVSILLPGNRAFELETYLGPGTTGGVDFDAPLGTVNLQIVLDTTGEKWTAEWLVNNVSLREETFATNPTINYIAIGRWSGATGTIDNLTLTSGTAIPEPSTYALIVAAFAAGVVALRRRTRRST